MKRRTQSVITKYGTSVGDIFGMLYAVRVSLGQANFHVMHSIFTNKAEHTARWQYISWNGWARNDAVQECARV
jgi:hypothetical protein